MGKRIVSFIVINCFTLLICRLYVNTTATVQTNIVDFDTRKEILWKFCEKKDESNQRNQKWKNKEEIKEKIEEET